MSHHTVFITSASMHALAGHDTNERSGLGYDRIVHVHAVYLLLKRKQGKEANQIETKEKTGILRRFLFFPVRLTSDSIPLLRIRPVPVVCVPHLVSVYEVRTGFHCWCLVGFAGWEGVALFLLAGEGGMSGCHSGGDL